MPEQQPPNNPPTDDGGKRGGEKPYDEARLLRLMRRAGGPNSAMIELLRENYQYREDKRELEAKLEAATTATTAATTELAQWKALGATPAEVKKLVDEVPALRAFKLDAEQAKVTDEAAEAMGWNATVLREVLKAKDHVVVFKDDRVTEDGETKLVRTAHVRPSAAAPDAATVPLSEYATANLAPFLPSLEAADAPARGGASERPAPPAAPAMSRQQFPRQGPASNGRKATAADEEKARQIALDKKRASGIYSM